MGIKLNQYMINLASILNCAFHDELSINIDLGSLNKINKYRDEIEFCREFVNLGACFTFLKTS